MGKSVVIVNTSAGSMGGGPTGVWLSELADPYYAFQAAGLEVTVASIAGERAARKSPGPWRWRGWWGIRRPRPTRRAPRAPRDHHNAARCDAFLPRAGGAIPIDANSMGDPYFGDQAKKFMHDQKAVGALTHSVKVEASMADAFDCVYLAGGHGCCVDFVGGAAKELKALVEAAFAKGKVVAADCHGPMGLLECTVGGAPLVKGLEVTAFTNIEEDQAGATEWVKASAGIKFCGTAYQCVGCTR